MSRYGPHPSESLSGKRCGQKRATVGDVRSGVDLAPALRENRLLVSLRSLCWVRAQYCSTTRGPEPLRSFASIAATGWSIGNSYPGRLELFCRLRVSQGPMRTE